MSQAACLGHILGSSVVTDTCENSLDKEEIMHWLNRMLHYAAETKRALTRTTSEAPTKQILNVKLSQLLTGNSCLMNITYKL